jgi:ankyrin repeat protein
LSANAVIDKRDNQGRTALFYASSGEAVKLLIAAGIDVSATCAYGDDSLGYQLDSLNDDENERIRITNVCLAMVESGLPLERNDARFGRSRLYRAAFSENLHALMFLLHAGHPANSDAYTTALHAICWHWDYGDERDENTRAIVQTLLKAGINANARAAGGNTPLHEAMSGDGSNLVAAFELLAAGADINAVNDDGVTPLLLHYETLFDYARVVPFLLDRGANPLITDKRGQSTLDAARRMAAGKNPMWRTEMFQGEDQAPCGWKEPAKTDDDEFQMLALLELAASRFRTGGAQG